MVEIRYSDYYEVSDLAGQSVAEARECFKSEFGIPDKARAKVNGKKIKGDAEADVMLGADDKLAFAEEKGKAVFLVGALLLALAVTGSVFAFGYVTQTTTLTISSAGSDFASITENVTTRPSISAYGLFKGSIGAGNLYNIDTTGSNYDGDLVATVAIANGDELVKVYRVMAMFIEVRDSVGSIVDINADSVNDTKDVALLTLNNGAVDLYIDGAVDTFHVNLKSGFYVSQIYHAGNWGAGATSPILYCDIAQR